jgi:hypothetical protein
MLWAMVLGALLDGGAMMLENNRLRRAQRIAKRHNGR